MSNIKKILLPFDFSESAVHALDYCMKFVGFERPIEIIALQVTVAPISGSKEKETREDFAKLLLRLKRKTVKSPKIITVSGPLIETVLKAQIKQNIDLILMGTMGDKNTEEANTNTSRLVLEANCPVMGVPYNCLINTPKEIALVLGKEEIEDPQVLDMLLEISRSYNSKVHVLTIYKESILTEKAIVEKNEKTLEYYLEHFYAEHSFSKEQDIEKGILSFIKEKKIDLLTILPRNHAMKTNPSEGRLTKLLTLHSEVPILTLD
ncbi:hypothetical protein MTsPCn9_29530 [Croceitalea sp. MTPC9]|uniref:universal stress protein n=1 Tax=unclassified Croceitalea TaxID=2632280 RepID=UPI002B394CAA|nr:hypothetical protein MTsPCn6_31020 [Croceitalea sp. MTPC6]GMN18013.1 hypothetical protein MTsPCn9_29530 [Croceitalea sp. MTPC9]